MVPVKMPVGQVSRSNSRASRGPMYAVISLLWVKKSTLIDVVIDLVAGDKWPQYLEALRPGGRYAVAGAIAGPLVELDVRTLYLKDLSLFGCTVLGPEVFNTLIKRIDQGAIKPVVARSFTLEEICDAQSLFLKKQHVGKIVLRI
jgi:NADPH:quinone reductase-like Zn-dependent oxidoreductase